MRRESNGPRRLPDLGQQDRRFSMAFHNINIFISHTTGEHGDVLAHVVPCLESITPASGYAVKPYTSGNEWERDGFPACLAKLRSADVLVAYVTPDFLNSPNCLQEIIRASELGLPIYGILREGDRPAPVGWRFIDKEFQDALPCVSFASAPKSFSPANGPDLAQNISKALSPLSQALRDAAWLEAVTARHALRMQLSLHREDVSVTSLAGKPKYLRCLLKALAEDHSLEFQQHVLKGPYELDLGRDRDFLIRARELFSTASDVYAYSRDTISGFWEREEKALRTSTLEYAVTQVPRCIRVFAFGDARRLNRYRSVLDLNDRVYGMSGAVFVCSQDEFRRIQQATGIPQDETDYGLLKYPIPNGPDLLLWATLDENRLTFKELRSGTSGECEKFSDLLAEAKRVTDEWRLADWSSDTFAALKNPSQGAAVGKLTPSHRGLLRWRPGLHKDLVGWSEVLKSQFPKQSETLGDVKHLVMFSLAGYGDDRDAPNTTSFRRELHKLCSDVREGLRNIGIRSPNVWVGERSTEEAVYDGRYRGGRLVRDIAKSRWEHVLYVDFPNWDKMEEWYQHVEHSDLRRRIYQILRPDVADLYKKADAASDTSDVKAILFDTIERIMRDSLWRLDFRRIDDYLAIAGDKPLEVAEAMITEACSRVGVVLRAHSD